MDHCSIGSSYLIRQTAGGERLGGLTVTVYPRYDGEGGVRVELTDWKTGEPHQYASDYAIYSDAALEGIQSLAVDLELTLGDFDVVLDRFVIHEVNSDPRVYRQAGRSALRAALEALNVRDV